MSSPILMIWPVHGQDGSVVMTRERAHINFRGDSAPGVRTPRSRLKPTAQDSGNVEGAGWPRSDDLVTEPPDLIAVQCMRLGAIGRMSHKITEWGTTPAELVIGGPAVRVDGYYCQPHNTLEVLDANGNKIVLPVAPARAEFDSQSIELKKQLVQAK
jgi:hypothetical protein